MSPHALTLLATASALCGFGWAMIAYSGYAIQRGWRVGEWYAGDFSWLQGIAYLALLGSLMLGYFEAGWWAQIVVVLVGNVIARLLLATAKESTQLVAPAAVLLFGVVSIVVWVAL